MRRWQIVGLVIAVLILVALTVIFWGSLFSLLMAICLLQIPIILLYNYFLNNDRKSDFIDDDNGF